MFLGFTEHDFFVSSVLRVELFTWNCGSPSQMKIINLMRYCWVAISCTPVGSNVDRHAVFIVRKWLLPFFFFLLFWIFPPLISQCLVTSFLNITPWYLPASAHVLFAITSRIMRRRSRRFNVHGRIIVHGITILYCTVHDVNPQTI